MSQLALPLEELDTEPTHIGAADGDGVGAGSEDDVQSSKDEKVQAVPTEMALSTRRDHQPRRLASVSSPEPKYVPVAWPAALTWNEALAYSSVAPARLRRWQRSGAISFRRVGRHGAKVVLRAQLDQLLERVFSRPPHDISEDFDFG